MVIQVNQELCTGCGTCVEECSAEAIQLVDQRAVIDETLCTACEACVKACPNEAIAVRSTPEPVGPILSLPAAQTYPIANQGQAALPGSAAPTHGLAPLAGAALAFLGREVAPRLVDVLISALERKLAQPVTTTEVPLSTSSRSLPKKNKGQRRQTRYRGGQSENKNFKGI